jgi:hypothetical protein
MPRPPKHGARALERRIRQNDLDGRTVTARALAQIGDALAEDRGGWSNVTAGERLLIERAAASVLFLRAIESWALRQPAIVLTGKDGARLLGPLQKGYTSHLGALTRALAALGVRPDKVDRLPDLSDYLQRHANGNGYDGAQRQPRSDAAPNARAEGQADDSASQSGSVGAP